MNILQFTDGERGYDVLMTTPQEGPGVDNSELLAYDVLQNVMAVDPEEWTWDDVMEVLAPLGFRIVRPKVVRY